MQSDLRGAREITRVHEAVLRWCARFLRYRRHRPRASSATPFGRSAFGVQWARWFLAPCELPPNMAVTARVCYLHTLAKQSSPHGVHVASTPLPSSCHGNRFFAIARPQISNISVIRMGMW